MRKNYLDTQYLSLAEDILHNGRISGDRTGTGTKKVFGRMLRFKFIGNNFPLLTSKEVHFKSVLTELLWFISGVTNIKPLVDQNNYIWVGDCYKSYLEYLKNSKSIDDEKFMMMDHKINSFNEIETFHRPMTRFEFIDVIKSAPKNYNEYNEKDIYTSSEGWSYFFVKSFAELGPVYGAMWNNFNGVNQLQQAIDTLQTNPNSRRILVSAWNPSELDKVILPPCHYGFQLVTEEMTIEERLTSYTNNDTNNDISIIFNHEDLDALNVAKYKLNLMFNQRSCDLLLGAPFNIASYGLLLMLFAQQVNMIPGELIASMGDVHIYLNQIKNFNIQNTNPTFSLPAIKINKAKSIFDYKVEDFELINYQHAGKVHYELSN